MAEASPLENLAHMVLEAKENREAAEETLNRTPSWRFRRRAGLERQVERRLAQERDLIALLRRASDESVPRSR